MGLTVWHFCWFSSRFSQSEKQETHCAIDSHFTYPLPIAIWIFIGQPDKNTMKRCQQFTKETFIKERHTKLQFLWLKQTIMKDVDQTEHVICRYRLHFLSLQFSILLFWQFSSRRLSVISFLFSSSFLWCPRSWSSGRECDTLKPKDPWRHKRELWKTLEFLQC